VPKEMISLRKFIYCSVVNFIVPDSVADPHHFDADPDPAFHFDADPDSDPTVN